MVFGVCKLDPLELLRWLGRFVQFFFLNKFVFLSLSLGFTDSVLITESERKELPERLFFEEKDIILKKLSFYDCKIKNYGKLEEDYNLESLFGWMKNEWEYW